MDLTIDDITNPEDYADGESSSSAIGKQIIEELKQNSAGVKDKQQAITLLRKMKETMVSNSTTLEQMSDNINTAKNIIKKEIDELDNPDTIKQLEAQNIDKVILLVCTGEYNKKNSRLQELNYRVNVLSYKTIFIKQQKEDIGSKIELVNKYIIALS